MIRDQRVAAQAFFGLLVVGMAQSATADAIAIPARDLSDRSNNVVPIDEQCLPHLAGLVVTESAEVRDEHVFADLFPPRADLAGPVNEDSTATRNQLSEMLPDIEQILFVKRYTFQSSHYYTDFIDGCKYFGGALCLLSLADGSVQELVPQLSHGIFGRCDLSYDGPDNLTTSVIYRMDADGGNIEKLSNNSVSESAPSVMNDGRILYTRWEYVDNGSVTNKGLWAMRPDGTGSEEVYGMSVAFPSVFNVARAVPRCNDLFVAFLLSSNLKLTLLPSRSNLDSVERASLSL